MTDNNQKSKDSNQQVKKLMNRKLKKFTKLTEQCYEDMIGMSKNSRCWMQAFDLLKEIVLEGRQNDPPFAPELVQLDDATDFAYDFEGWIEDFTDELDMNHEYETLLRVCDDLLDLFGWLEYTGSDVKFMRSSALISLGRKDEAALYCREWIQKEPENIAAAAASVYALTAVRDFDAAEQLIHRFIIDSNECTEENDIMFTAASRFYEITGNKKAKKKMDQALEAYEESLKDMFDMDGFDDDFDEDVDDLLAFLDERLPFN